MKHENWINGETYTRDAENNKFDKVRISRISRITTGLVAAVLLVLVSGLISAAPAGKKKQPAGCEAPTPAGFIKFLVYMAEPTLAPGEPASFTDPAHVDFFQQGIMGRSPAEQAQDRANAEQFFLERFGLDFTRTEPDANGVETIPGATFNGYFLNPNVNYTAYVISEEAVPSQGWIVRDGGWAATLTEDMLLHGTYGGAEGKWVKAGATVVFGDYNIKVERAKGPPHSRKNILIHYESNSPVIADQDGVISFVCDLTHPEWGLGQVRGLVFPAANLIIRNVLTFPPQLQ